MKNKYRVKILIKSIDKDKIMRDAIMMVSNGKSRKQCYTMYQVLYGKKKDRGGIRKKINNQYIAYKAISDYIHESLGPFASALLDGGIY